MHETLDALRGFTSKLLLALHGIDEADLRRPEPVPRSSSGLPRWSILEVVAHLGDLELTSLYRIRAIIAFDDPPLPALAQDAWVARLHRSDRFADLIEQFSFYRRMNVSLAERLSEEELARTGVHPEYGPRSIRELLEKLAQHQEKHLGQIERIKSAHGLVASTKPDLRGVVGAYANGTSYEPGPGVRIRELWRDGIKRALQVEFDAGAQWPGIDYHVPGPEEVYVVRGDFNDGANVYRGGAFIHHPAGSSHSPISQNGCTLIVFYPEG